MWFYEVCYYGELFKGEFFILDICEFGIVDISLGFFVV